ncbi:MAG: nucleolar RNA-binding Nop10p family protein [Nanoarchaeota archaeon]
MNNIFKCNGCQIYTLKKICRLCGSNTISPKPGKFSLEDKYGLYRRKYKDGMDYKI